MASTNTRSDLVFFDTSVWKALVDEEDDFHNEAVGVLERLEKAEKRYITSNYILDESFTLIRVRCGLKRALFFRDYLASLSGSLEIARVKSEDEKNAWKWFEKDWNRLSFTDCVSFSQLDRLGIERVFSFDKHFERAGFGVE